MATLNVAERITLGREGLPVDAIGRGNIWLEEDYSPRTVRIAQEVMLKSLLGTDPGELELVVFDYNLRGVAAPFAGLQSDHLLRVLITEKELTDYCDKLEQHIHGVHTVIQGRQHSLLDFRAATGKRVESYILVVITADMYMLDDHTKELLSILMAAGPDAGVTFLVVSPTPDDPSVVFLSSKCRVIATGAAPTPNVASNVIIDSCTDLAERFAKSTMDPVLFEDVCDTSPQAMWTGNSTDGVTFDVGMYGLETTRVTIGSNREQLHNALITGAVGQGKSNLIAVIIHSLCQRYSPRELELYLLDFKEGVTLRQYANIDHQDYLPHVRALGLESDVEFGMAVLQHLYAVYQRRMRLFKRHGCQNIKQYREATGAVIPRIIVVIDEFQMMLDDKSMAREVVDMLSRSTRLFRAAGIHFILASQTIASGIALSKDSDIFAQTPIRMAHRNSIRESEATLGLGNTAAADLHMGQAIVNLDYGAIASNRKVSVAWADDKVLAGLRRNWWLHARNFTRPPYVYDGTKTIRLDAAADDLLASRGGRPELFVGERISVGGTALRLDFGEDSGRNLAVFGAGEEQFDDAAVDAEEVTGIGSVADDASSADTQDAQGASRVNAAVGLLQNAAIALAVRNTKGNARFIICDLTEADIARSNDMNGFYQFMESIGFPIERVERDGLGSVVDDLADSLGSRTDEDDLVYLIGFGLDKVADMPNSFGRLIKDGPAKGVHVLGWWLKTSMFESHVGFGNNGYFDIKIMLRLDERDVQRQLGPFVSWKARDNRAFVADSTYLSEPVTVIPYAPANQETRRRITSALFGY